MSNLALVTGASSGIGKALATLHASRGGDVILVARREDRLNALKTALETAHGITAHVIAADLSQESAPQVIFDQVEAMGLSLDILINNAGFGGRGLFIERDWSNDRDMIQVNVIALTALTRLFLPKMVEKGAGRVLNVSSTAGEMPGPLQAVYFATKAFVTSFSNALMEELRGTGVTVTALLPGATESEFAATSDMDKTSLFQSTASAESVAKDGYEAMMAGKLNVISGVPTSRRIMYALAPILPTEMLMREVRKAQEV